ncbi:MAG TPA: hypothetical protein VFB67_07465 [Candidatus Polarisedimenticolaceae bacterium]|nr:hypothetical protein [Candidatus Polarisedimenticolaceae bacterium]
MAKAKKKAAKRTAVKKAVARKKAPKAAARRRTAKPASRKKAARKAVPAVAARPAKTTLGGRSSKPGVEIRLAVTPPIRSGLSPRPQPGQLAMPASFSLEHPIEPVHRRPIQSFERALPPHDLEE